MIIVRSISSIIYKIEYTVKEISLRMNENHSIYHYRYQIEDICCSSRKS